MKSVKNHLNLQREKKSVLTKQPIKSEIDKPGGELGARIIQTHGNSKCQLIDGCLIVYFIGSVMFFLLFSKNSHAFES